MGGFAAAPVPPCSVGLDPNKLVPLKRPPPPPPPPNGGLDVPVPPPPKILPPVPVVGGFAASEVSLVRVFALLPPVDVPMLAGVPPPVVAGLAENQSKRADTQRDAEDGPELSSPPNKLVGAPLALPVAPVPPAFPNRLVLPLEDEPAVLLLWKFIAQPKS